MYRGQRKSNIQGFHECSTSEIGNAIYLMCVHRLHVMLFGIWQEQSYIYCGPTEFQDGSHM